MEHNEATETMAAERYLLGEMTPEDRDAFEEHFFGCSACAADVSDGARVGAAIRSEAANRTRQPSRFGAARWLIASAPGVVVAGMLLVQNIALQRPQAVHLISSLSASRNSLADQTPSAPLPLTLEYTIPPTDSAQSYVVDVVDTRGKVKWTEKISAKAAGDLQHLFFPDGSLPPGRYELKVRAVPNGSSEPAGSFVVVR